ncbi:uncharacterized protein LOC132696456 [Cylas formicarius]|uniref:uncharacterized protein LOC132696456 n=1 Tax=Cylas formicarius TaxID=197179 RepID=UPI0029586E28|nr:uncharacterized protein LOC132696456 [Cylas formicarius]
MKIAIVGAGPAGLAAIRHCLEAGCECVGYEQTGNIGGIWNYTENADRDENGLPVHSSMYQGLCTNLPKELMEYEGFYYTEPDHSFITQEEVLRYVRRFANDFKLLPYIKFFTQVTLIDPTDDDQWRVRVKNVKTGDVSENLFDGVLVCNGHYFEPSLPSIPGMERVETKSIHSHLYRTPDAYKNKRVLVIGAGPSGIDISRLVAAVAEKVFLSFSGKPFGGSPQEVAVKPRVRCFEESKAIFEDDTEESFDHIIYCTGYKNIFPFLSEQCGITVEDNWVKPLYKHLINIEHPSMAITNLISAICPFPIFGLQIRFFLALLKGHFTVSKEEMYEDLKVDRARRDSEKLPLKKAHFIGTGQGGYCEDLAKTAGIEPVASVIHKMYVHYADSDFARRNYRVIDKDNFVVMQ